MGEEGFDNKEHTTVQGKVVYRRDKNKFKYSDVARILSKIDLTIEERENIIKSLTIESDDIENIQEFLLEIFITILDSVFPRWVGNLVEWIYRNVDAGRPPWIPDNIQ